MTLNEFEYLNKKLYGVNDYKISRFNGLSYDTGDKTLFLDLINIFSNKFVFSSGNFRLSFLINEGSLNFNLSCVSFFRFGYLLDFLKSYNLIDVIYNIDIRPVVDFPNLKLTDGKFTKVSNVYYLSGTSPLIVEYSNDSGPGEYIFPCDSNGNVDRSVPEKCYVKTIGASGFLNVNQNYQLYPSLIRSQGTEIDDFTANISVSNSEFFGSDLFLIEYSPDVKIW